MQCIYNQTFTNFIETKVQAQPVRNLEAANDMLDATRFFVHITRSALKAFTKHKFSKFDGLVGDTACQIRAVKIVELAKRYDESPAFQKEVKDALERFNAYQTQLFSVKPWISKTFPKDIKHAKFTRFCDKFKVDGNVSEDLRFIVESYLLRVAKGESEDPEAFYSNKETINYTNFDQRCVKYQQKTLSESALKRWIQAFQQDLAQASVQYLLNKVESWPESAQRTQLKQDIAKYSVFDEYKRQCSPCYFNMQVVWKEIFAQQLPVYIHVCRWTQDGRYIDSVRFLYKTSSQGFEPCEEPLPDNAPVVFMHGVSLDNQNAQTTPEEFRRKFKSHGLADILDANWAQHKQFPKKLDGEIALPPDARRTEYLQHAREWGCSQANKSLFLAVHMLSDTYRKAVEKDKLL